MEVKINKNNKMVFDLNRNQMIEIGQVVETIIESYRRDRNPWIMMQYDVLLSLYHRYSRQFKFVQDKNRMTISIAEGCALWMAIVDGKVKFSTHPYALDLAGKLHQKLS